MDSKEGVVRSEFNQQLGLLIELFDGQAWAEKSFKRLTIS